MIQAVSQWAVNLIASLGYVGLGIAAFLNAAGVPIPSEVVLPLSGALVRQGKFSFVVVIAVAVIAQTLGASLAYWIGNKGGVPVIERYGRYVLFNRRELEITQRWFVRYGRWLAFVGRCLPVICTYIGYPAGISGMPFGQFLAASLAGAIIWSTALVSLGYFLAGQLPLLVTLLHRFSLVIVVLLAVALVWYVKRRLTQRA